MEKLIGEFSSGLFIWQTIVFLALLFLLRKFAWKPILNAVESREQSIEGALEAAEKAKEEMQNLQADNERLLIEARAERDAMLKDANEAKKSIVAEAKTKASEEGAKMIANAKAEIENQKKAAINELKSQVAELSIQIAEKVVRENLSSDDKHNELVNNMINDIELN